MARSSGGSLVDQSSVIFERRLRLRCDPLDRAKLAGFHELAGRLDQRRERPIGIGIEECVSTNQDPRVACVQVRDETVEGIWANDLDTGRHPKTTVSAHEDKGR